jgi:hypothetical protein
MWRDRLDGRYGTVTLASGEAAEIRLALVLPSQLKISWTGFVTYRVRRGSGFPAQGEEIMRRAERLIKQMRICGQSAIASYRLVKIVIVKSVEARGGAPLRHPTASKLPNFPHLNPRPKEGVAQLLMHGRKG